MLFAAQASNRLGVPMRRTLSLALAASLLLLVACSSGDDQGENTCTTKDDCAAGQVCIQNRCVNEGDTGGDTADVQADLTYPETAQDVVPDEAGTPDTPPDPGTPELPTPDVPVEADDTPPTVASTIPAADQDDVAIPFVVKVFFSAPMKTPTIYEQSFVVEDINGQQVAGAITFEANDTTAVFTPTAGVLAASPYTVTIKGSIVQDAAGNRLGDWFEYTFYTRPPKDLDTYRTLAETYAPVIHQATDQTAPHYDYLTSFDLDGNWGGPDNLQYIQQKATEVSSVVYYDVVESLSHYFIRYIYFYPFRNTTEPTERFSNDVSGAMVVLRKLPTVEPISVQTYYKRQSDEPSNAFVTSESGIVPQGSSADAVRVNAVYPRDQLFPDGRYAAYLTSGTHQSCLWLWEGTGAVVNYCKLSAAMKTELESHRILYVWKGVAEKLAKGSGWPKAKEDVGYELQSLIVKLWPRRKAEGLVGGSEMTYAPPDGRPGSNLKFGKSFVTSLDGDFAHAPWAWRWWQSGVAGYELPRGAWFLDPAYYVSTRHNLYAPFNADTGEGFSRDYCFNPYFNIDQRATNPACQ